MNNTFEFVGHNLCDVFVNGITRRDGIVILTLGGVFVFWEKGYNSAARRNLVEEKIEWL